MNGIIGHIILNVKNFVESELFYDSLLQALGFEIDHFDSGEWGKIKSYKQGEHNLWIRYDTQKDSKEFVRDVGLDHLAIEVKNENEVDEIFEIINKLNVLITREPKKYPEYSETYYAFFFRDPNGIPLEVYMQ